ncbi:helix-turn-helix domain-containing protein [Oerskovia enterophila]|uniref:HTH-type transcriptional repressor of iron protein A n=1 Tax=Oerskovia enterophila TaxID=43678 RepID=A0ABX2XYV3_9CELL|nr:helix-turn-helix transcriptional regulator [Oerskovia enterophila]OCI29478.1 HTH-type transcriptional repressor of iron protein A [Oerskovia enterophila]
MPPDRDPVENWLPWGSPSQDALVVQPEDASGDVDFVLAGGPSRTHQPVVWLEHSHRTHEVLVALSGLLTVRAGDDVWALPPRNGLWIPAGLPHAVRAGTDSRFLTVYLDPGRSRDLGPEPVTVAPSALFSELVLHLTSQDMPDEARHHAEQVAIHLLEPVTASTRITVPTVEPVARIVHELLDDPGDDRTLAQWARHVGLSTSTLGRVFRRASGQPFGRWRLHLRMNVAMARLSEGARVSDVADAVGYTSTSAFVAVFRRETGLTPGSFRDAARSPDDASRESGEGRPQSARLLTGRPSA